MLSVRGSCDGRGSPASLGRCLAQRGAQHFELDREVKGHGLASEMWMLVSPVSVRRAGWAPAPWRAAWKGRQCCLQALETHVGTAVGLATWLQGGQAALSGHRRAVAQEPLLVPRGSDHPRAPVGAPVTWSWKRGRASSLGGGCGRWAGDGRGSSSWWALGGNPPPLGLGGGSGWRGRFMLRPGLGCC